MAKLRKNEKRLNRRRVAWEKDKSNYHGKSDYQGAYKRPGSYKK